MRSLLLVMSFLWISSTFGQSGTIIKGQIRNERGRVLQGVAIYVNDSSTFTISDIQGRYAIQTTISAGIIKLTYKHPDYTTKTLNVASGNKLNIRDVILVFSTTILDSVTIGGNKKRPDNLTTIDAGLIKNLPSVSGNFESVLKTLPGVSSNNELSSQYSVRGGNFDGNLIYINDIEIFRPTLIRNGQQEGLSFINSELVSKASFSAGGFEAKYGDKLSSALDIRYNKPDSTEINAAVSLLGFSTTLKLPTKNSYFLFGFRNKSNQSILRTQPVVGSYQPKFYDIQALFSSDLSEKLSVSLFADYNLNHFTLVPKSRETIFGTLNQQYRLNINYEGSEKDRYTSSIGALTLNYKPNQNTGLKWINSIFQTDEKETFDLEGSYIFEEIKENVQGFENVSSNRGIGINYQHARNELNATVYSSELKGFKQTGKSFWEAGFRYQFDRFADKLNEYQLIDSAGFTLPYISGPLVLTDVVSSKNTLTTNRITSFFQNTFQLSPQLSVSAGLRSNYNSYTQQLLISPRVNALYKPKDRNTEYRAALGMYDQPPFYRELRNFKGDLNPNAKAQRSIHVLGAADYYFNALNTKLKFTSEVYYKKLNDLVPYKIENLRIRYYSDQLSNGYAVGADFALNGEFVKGLESSFRLSFMKTEEDIINDSYQIKSANGSLSTVYPGYLKRPTDQRVNFSAFFQDKLFNSPSNKVHLNMLYGSALPVGPPQTERYQDIFKIPSYKRVDIGFSKDFVEGKSGKKVGFMTKYFSSFIGYAEVFNLLNINNTVSFLWIKDVNNYQFAIPNYLTSRQLNIKFIAKIKN